MGDRFYGVLLIGLIVVVLLSIVLVVNLLEAAADTRRKRRERQQTKDRNRLDQTKPDLNIRSKNEHRQTTNHQLFD